MEIGFETGAGDFAQEREIEVMSRRAMGQLVFLLVGLVVFVDRCSAYGQGDFVPTSRKGQYHNVSFVGLELQDLTIGSGRLTIGYRYVLAF